MIKEKVKIKITEKMTIEEVADLVRKKLTEKGEFEKLIKMERMLRCDVCAAAGDKADDRLLKLTTISFFVELQFE